MRVRWLLGLGGVGLLGLCGAVLAVGLALTAPRPGAAGGLPDGLPGVEAVAFASGSGSVIHGWMAPGRAGGGVVVLLHGIGEDRRRMLARARVLGGAGFGTLLIDLQGHGESAGRRITLGRLEALDAVAAVAFVRSRAAGERVGAIGFSLGGAALVLGPGPLDVDALVLEGVYPDIESALGNRLRVALGPTLGGVAAPALVVLFDVLLPPFLGVRPSELRPIDGIAGIRAPLLLASGTEDERTPVLEARALFDRAPEPKSFWAVAGAAHVDLERYSPGAYWGRVMPFLSLNLRARSRGL